MLKALVKNRKGNAIIWITAIAVMIAPIVAGFANRLLFNTHLQSAAIERKNKKAAAENFLDYMQTLPESQLEQIAAAGSFGNEINEITGRLAREAQSIEGALDHGQESPVYSISERVKIEWNRCDLNEKGILAVNGKIQAGGTQNCGAGSEFRKNLFFTPTAPLTLSSLTGILHYRITAESGQPIQDGNWHLALKIPLHYGVLEEMINIQRTFAPTAQ